MNIIIKEDYNIELIPPPKLVDNIKADLNFKLLVVGNPNCEKLLMFKEYHQEIMGLDFLSFFAIIKDKILVRLQIYESCDKVGNLLFQEISLIILVYNINDIKSFNDLGTWLKQIKAYVNKNARIFLIGNYVDIEKDRKITEEEGKKFQLETNLDLFIEISKKTKDARIILLKAIKLLYDDYLKKLNKFNKLNKYLNF